MKQDVVQKEYTFAAVFQDKEQVLFSIKIKRV